MNIIGGAATFSPLRQEIHLHPGPPALDGTPTWSLHDPASNRFFRIGWLEFEIICRWEMANPEEIAHCINSETTLTVTPEHVTELLEFALHNQLVQPQGQADMARFEQQVQTIRQRSNAKRLITNYLFFRVPLLRPDQFLQRTLPAVQWFFAPTFWSMSFGVSAQSAIIIYCKTNMLESCGMQKSVGSIAQLGNKWGGVWNLCKYTSRRWVNSLQIF